MKAIILLFIWWSVSSGFIVVAPSARSSRVSYGSFLDDFFGKEKDTPPENEVDETREQEEELSLGAFKNEVARRGEADDDDDDDDEEFDGYALRDVIVEKWGECFDVDFNKVETMGIRELYLNILPFRLGSKRFRHETELDYLCHLQAVAEILLKYDQVGNILYQIDQTNKKPRAGTSPLIAVPLRLDLTPEQVDRITGR